MISRLSQKKAARFGLALVITLVGMTLEAAQTNSQQLVEQGQRAFQTGAYGQAAIDWEKAVEDFRSQGNTNAEIRTSISLASAYQAMGQLRRAVQILEDSLSQAAQTRDRSLITLAEWKLGAALVMTSEPQRGEVLLNKALDAARADRHPEYSAAILNDLGNSLSSQQRHPEALKAYQESSTLSQQSSNLCLA